MPELWQEASPAIQAFGLSPGSAAFAGYNGPVANLPAPNTVPVGYYARVTDLGVGGTSEWVSDGTIWRPRGGSVLLYQRLGSVASPVATINGNGTNVNFVIPDVCLIPPQVLYPGIRVYAAAKFRRTALAAGAVASASRVCLGSSGHPVNDLSMLATTLSATLNQEHAAMGYADVVSNTVYKSQNYVIWNGISVAGFFDRTVFFNTTGNTYVTFGCTSTLIAGDVLALLDYTVRLEG